MLAQELQICTQQYEMPIDIKLLISSSSARVSSVILILDGKLAIYIDSREDEHQLVSNLWIAFAALFD